MMRIPAALLAIAGLAAAERPPWRLDLVVMNDDYSATRQRESQIDIALGRRLPGNWTPVLAYSREHRFGANDDRYEGWLYTPGFGPAYGWVALAATPSNDFLADWEWQAGAEAEFATGTSVTGRLHWRHYPDEQTTSPTLALRQQALPWLAVDGGYTWGMSNQEPIVGTAMAGVQVAFAPGWSARLGGSQGRENAPPLPAADVRTISGTLRWRMSSQVAWRLDVTWEDREDLYERLGTSLGMTVSF